jgi:hypothetical protein
MFYTEININDILKTDLMPTSFMVSGDKRFKPSDIESRTNDDGLELGSGEGNASQNSINGTIDAALSTLTYHR